MRVSRNAGLLAGLGLAAASLTWTVAALSGLGLLLSHAGWISEGIRIVGALYLVFIGVKTLVGARPRHP
jgi:threonine efflux protein